MRISSSKWKKIRIYLGDREPTKLEIKKFTKEIEEKINLKRSNFTFLTNDDAEILQDLKEGYKEWLKKTPESLKKKLNEDFVIRFTYNSNAIEGNRLTLRQTALILKDKVIPSGVKADDYNEAVNGKECLDFLKTYEGGLNNKFIKKINEILTKNTGVEFSGKIRPFDVRIEGSSHAPPKYEELEKHLLNMYKWYSANKNKLHPFELAVMIHSNITWIHPFEDGNGRTSRAIMNWILMNKGFPMFFIPFEKREEYYNVLEEFDKKNNKKYVAGMFKLIIDQIRSYGHNKKK